MSVTSRPRSSINGRARGGGNVVDDLSAELAIAWPRTEWEWTLWRIQRAQMRREIARWARAQAREDPLVNPGRAALEMARMLGVTGSEDDRLYEKYRRAVPVSNGKRAILYWNKRGG